MAVPVDVHADALVPQVYNAQVPVGARVLFRMGLRQIAKGALLGDGLLQLEARPVEHVPVVLNGGFQGSAGKELQLLRLPMLVFGDTLDGIVKVIPALFLV